MPKETTHWLIAEQAVALLAGSPLGSVAAAYPKCLRLGAVFPDILFFIPDQGVAANYHRLADRLHGSDGEDTYAFLRDLLSCPVEAGYAGPLAAFWVGVAAHIRVDMMFHPLVYFLTGPYHDSDPVVRSRAVQRHRRLETAMDMYFLAQADKPSQEYLLWATLKGLEIPLPYLLKIAARSICHTEDELAGTENALRRGLKNFVTIQALCRRRWIGFFLCAMERILPGSAHEVTALFHAPQLESHFPFLRGEMTYQHPVTGEEKVTTIDGLFRQAIDDCVDFCNQKAAAVLERKPELIREQGPSLSFGMSGMTKADARYFAASPCM